MDWLDGAVLRGSGEDAFVVEYGEEIAPEIGRRVAALADAFDRAAPDGLVEVVPTFRSLLVLYDPERTTREALLAALPAPDDDPSHETGTHWTLPVCLEGEAAEDIAECAAGLGISEARLREIFLAGTYQVGMYGFAPGFAYLSGVDEALAIPRRPQPRPPMPAGSLILAGGMAALTSISMPTGWYVIGRTAITLFRPEAEPMVPFAVGDRIAFRAVPLDELDRLAATHDGGLTRTTS
ncbi:allophanate hydrolase subunit 1 [Acuticoccus sp. M5D2P5]|uniref:5-oxoprolinase subunit B family protein n=1 Tax=Acuticoccus kalidii TaxID=2910977 RepID=UPI001F35B6BE|nr:allophanate hydrolase subunit 1 [Acuticoccus kalidii]MCF3932180.1 allophanate hydrolase subunit 1 [Acuticoccus kalidii]